MKSKIFLIISAVVLIVMGTAARCPAKTPKIQESLCTKTTCAVVYNNKDDQKLLVYVEKAKFGNCAPGKTWPTCAANDISRGMRNIPYNENPDYPKQESDKGGGKNAKSICVSSVSEPEAKITNTWFVGEMTPRAERNAVQGIFQKCNIALPGQPGYIKSEHHATPSTLMCTVFWSTLDGDRIVLDMMITQALGDCVAQAVVP